MGLPIDRIVLATNANTTIADYLATGQWLPRATMPTLASAMDVGNPSNMERLRDLCGDFEEIRGEVAAVPVSDDEIRLSIRDEYRRHQLPWCPHTAAALYVYRQLSENERRERHWIVVATAHPAKFESIVEPLIGSSIPLPLGLARLLALPSRFETITPDIGEIEARL
jgi:threonine synthase